MHILKVPSEYPTKDHKLGGIFVKEQTAELKKKIEVGIIHIYQFSIYNIFKVKLLDLMIYSKRKKFYRFSIPRIPKLKIINFYTHYLFFKIFFISYVKNHGKPDIIHAHFSEFTSYTLYKIKKKYGIPYVITEHSTDFIDKRFEKSYNSYSYKIVKKGFANAERVICVSNFLKLAIVKIFKIKNTIVIPNFTKKINYISKKKYDFIFVGDLIERKNPFLLLHTYKKYFDDKKLLIIGNGELKKDIIKFKKKNNLKNLYILSNLERRLVLKKISESKTLILTSSFETFGVVLIEAISLGLNVISTDSGGPKDIVNKTTGTLIKPKINELMKAINKIQSNSFNRNKIINFYNLNFSSAIILKKIIKIYEQIKKDAYTKFL